MCQLSQVLPALLLNEQVDLPIKKAAARALRRTLFFAAHGMSDNDMKELADTLLPCLQLEAQPALLIGDLCCCMAFLAAHTVNWETAMEDLGKSLSTPQITLNNRRRPAPPALLLRNDCFISGTG
jgi:hypothetical protein